MIILDLDGVCADFANAACVAHNHADYEVLKWNFFEDWPGRDKRPMTLDEFWDGIHVFGDAFYGKLIKPYPWMPQLLEAVDEADDWVIMSSPSNDACGYAAKKIWVDLHIQPMFEKQVKLIVGSEKHLLAGPDRLLIDDYEKNIACFREAGGHTLMFPQPWNSQRDSADDPLWYLKHSLKFWTELQSLKGVVV